MDPFTASFLAGGCIKALSAGGEKALDEFFSRISESEIEQAADETAENYRNITKSIIIDALSTDDYEYYINSDNTQEIEERLAERIEAAFEEEQNEGNIENTVAVANEFLINLEEIAIRDDEDYFRLQIYRMSKKQGKDINEITNKIDQFGELLRTTGTYGERYVPRPRFEDSSEQMDQDSFATVIDVNEPDSEYVEEFSDVMHKFVQTKDRLNIPITQSIALNNEEGVIHDCSIQLDYIAKLEDNWKFDYATFVDEQLLHLQTKLPWIHPTNENTITLGHGDRVDLQLLAETKDWAIAFPSRSGFPDLATANLYGSRNPDAKFPSDWWWLVKRDVSARFYDHEKSAGILRITGSNIKPQYAILEFDWEEWKTGNRDEPMPVTIEEIHDPNEKLDIPIDIDSLYNTIGDVPRNIENNLDLCMSEDMSIETIGHPDDPLPSELTFSSMIPNTELAANLSLALSSNEAFSFSFDDYASAVTARRINNRGDDLEYLDVPEVESQLRGEDGSLQKPFRWRVSDMEIEVPTTDELEEYGDQMENIWMTEAAFQDLDNFTNEEKTEILYHLMRLSDPQRLCLETTTVINSNLFDRPLYRLEDTGIIFWINPRQATPDISESIARLIVEAVLDEDAWRERVAALTIR